MFQEIKESLEWMWMTTPVKSMKSREVEVVAKEQAKHKHIKPLKVSQVDKQIHEREDQINIYVMRRVLLEKKISELETKAKDYLNAGKRPMALQSIKLKKQYEDQIQTLNQQILNLETLNATIESTLINMDTLNMQKKGAEQLKTMLKNKTVADIEKTKDEIMDTMEDIQEVTDVLAQPLETTKYDDDELEGELTSLMNTAKRDEVVIDMSDVQQLQIPKENINNKEKKNPQQELIDFENDMNAV